MKAIAVVDLKKITNNPSLENILLQAYEENMRLPWVWQLIYQEALRANHLLFDSAELAQFDDTKSGETPINHDVICDKVMDLAKCTSLREIRTQIDQLSLHDKQGLIALYRHWLRTWQQFVTASLN